MTSIVIERCPICPNIRSRAQEVSERLKDDLGLDATIEDGAKGEFSIYVDGVPVIQMRDGSSPTVEEVEKLMREIPVGV